VRAFLLSLVFVFSASESFAKAPLWIGWKPLEGAVRYELEVRGKNFEFRKKLPDRQLKWNRDLPPGAYIFRLRGVDAFGRPGEWAEGPTQVTLARVNTFPVDMTSYKMGASIRLRWEPVEGAEKYQLWIWKGEKVVEEKTVSGTEWDFEPIAGGEYMWSVSATVESIPKFATVRETASGPPSEKRSFRIPGEKAARQIASVSIPSFEIPSVRIGFTYFANSYDWRVESSSLVGRASSKGIGGEAELNFPIYGRLSGWLRFGHNRHEIDTLTISRQFLEALWKFQVLGDRQDQGYGVSLYAGADVRKHYAIDAASPALASVVVTEFGTFGIGFGVQGYASLGRQWRLRGRVGFRLPALLIGTKEIFIQDSGLSEPRVDLTLERFLNDKLVVYFSPSWYSDAIRYSPISIHSSRTTQDSVLSFVGGLRLVF
jgi:hypothetical protein